jgi:hypothetical protein
MIAILPVASKKGRACTKAATPSKQEPLDVFSTPHSLRCAALPKATGVALPKATGWRALTKASTPGSRKPLPFGRHCDGGPTTSLAQPAARSVPGAAKGDRVAWAHRERVAAVAPALPEPVQRQRRATKGWEPHGKARPAVLQPCPASGTTCRKSSLVHAATKLSWHATRSR